MQFFICIQNMKFYCFLVHKNMKICCGCLFSSVPLDMDEMALLFVWTAFFSVLSSYSCSIGKIIRRRKQRG